MPENKVKFGLSKCYYALYDEDQDTYGTPVAVPGAVSLTLDPQGDQSVFYADNIQYYVTYANNGYSGDWEMARIPDQMRQDLWGDALDATAKVLTENSSIEPKHFALLFQVEGDKQARLAVFYNCVAARPGSGSSTITETKEPQTDTCSITASPLSDGKVKAVTTAETPDATKNTWFTSVFRAGASN
jgi:phi13 family phage major tail protein